MTAWYQRPPKYQGESLHCMASKGNEITKPSEVTSALDGCLSHYLTLEKPGYAVLVTGAWGTGKTHQVQRLIPPDQTYYVSLFGVNSVEQAKRAVFAKMSPIKNFVKGTGDALNQVGIDLPAGGSISLGAIPSSLIGAFVNDNVKSDRVLILDDLERTSLDSKQLLSLVNGYVEHHGLKVIVLCHQGKLGEDFQSTSEKVFGRIIEVKPETEEAFTHFIEGPEFAQHKAILIETRSLILEIFAESKISSLRILRFALDDICRYLAALTQSQLDNKEHTQLLMRHLTAFAIEARAGNLKRGDFTNRTNTIRGAQLKRHTDRTLTDLHPLEVMNKKYANFDATDLVISDEILENLLVGGFCEHSKIIDWINQSPYFLPASDVRPWIVVWNSRHYEYMDVVKAYQKMDLALVNYEYTDPGEILHIFALKQDLLPDNCNAADREDLLKVFQDYIRELRKRNQLLELWPEERRRSLRRETYGGYGFMTMESNRAIFDMFLEFLDEERTNVHLGKYPDFQLEILDALATNSEQFSELIAYTVTRSGKYQEIPVLKGIVPVDFVRAWLDCPKDWHDLTNALERRYEAGRLSEEYDWLDTVVDLMEIEVAKLPTLKQRQLRHGIPRKIQRAE